MSEGIQWPETYPAEAVSCQPPLTKSWKCVQSVILWYYPSCTKQQHSHALNRQHIICVAGLGSYQESLWHKDRVKNIKMIYDSMQPAYLFSGHHSFHLCLGGQRLLSAAALLCRHRQLRHPGNIPQCPLWRTTADNVHGLSSSKKSECNKKKKPFSLLYDASYL